MNKRGASKNWAEVALLLIALFFSLYFSYSRHLWEKKGQEAAVESIREANEVIAQGTIERLGDKLIAIQHDEFFIKDKEPIVYYALRNSEDGENSFFVYVFDEKQNAVDATYEKTVTLNGKQAKVFGVKFPQLSGSHSYVIVVRKDSLPYASVDFYVNFNK